MKRFKSYFRALFRLMRIRAKKISMDEHENMFDRDVSNISVASRKL